MKKDGKEPFTVKSASKSIWKKHLLHKLIYSVTSHQALWSCDQNDLVCTKSNVLCSLSKTLLITFQRLLGGCMIKQFYQTWTTIMVFNRGWKAADTRKLSDHFMKWDQRHKHFKTDFNISVWLKLSLKCPGLSESFKSLQGSMPKLP